MVQLRMGDYGNIDVSVSLHNVFYAFDDVSAGAGVREDLYAARQKKERGISLSDIKEGYLGARDIVRAEQNLEPKRASEDGDGDQYYYAETI